MSWCSPLLNCLHNGQENSVEYQLSVTTATGNGIEVLVVCRVFTKYLKFHIPFVLWSVGRFLFIGKKSLIVSQLTAICHCRNFEGISLGHTDVSGYHHSCLKLHSDGHKKKSKESWILVFKKKYIYIKIWLWNVSVYIDLQFRVERISKQLLELRSNVQQVYFGAADQYPGQCGLCGP